MPFEWDPALSVGVDELDVQHRQLLWRVAQARAAVDEGRLAAAAAAVRFLVRYLADHCAAEERWMAENAYPGEREHARAHREVVATAAALREAALLAAAPGAPDEAAAGLAARLDAVAAWLDRHLRADDLKLGRWRVMRENLRQLGDGGRCLTPVPRLGRARDDGA